jgi:hypothetical protein
VAGEGSRRPEEKSAEEARGMGTNLPAEGGDEVIEVEEVKVSSWFIVRSECSLRSTRISQSVGGKEEKCTKMQSGSAHPGRLVLIYSTLERH